ncbi:SpoIIE family protein phosphatase [Streptomyces sp. NPDC001380]|uniref:SpoIIE family protein phosphatase n=1 Tax=Streptomyces sp. NPDC001380 TaxID=3364566 RepID=UPI0036AE537A
MADDDVLMVVDGRGLVAEWGHRAEELFGLAAAEVVGRPVSCLVPGAGDPGGDGPRLPQGHPVGELRVRPLIRGGSVLWAVRQAGPAGPDALGAAVLKALFTRSPVGLHVLDDRLRVVRVNKATRAMRGRTVEEFVGRHLTEAYGLVDPAGEEAAARRMLETGVPSVDRLVRARPGPDRGERVYSVSTFRVQEHPGGARGLVAAVVDVTDREAGRARMRVLSSVREGVGRTLDVVATCREFVDVVASSFADIAVVEVVDEVVRGEEPPLVPLDRDVPLRRAAFRGFVSAYPVGDVRRLPYGTPFARVLADLRPRLVPLSPDSPWLGADPARADAIRRSRAHSMIAAPLALRGAGLGVVSLYRCAESPPFDEDDVALAVELCAHTALCVDNARRYTRERTIAATVQRRLLPQRPSVRTAVDIAPLHLSGPEGGGAWFDAIALPGARTALVVGDVAGGGIQAATTMGQLRTVIHSLAALDLEPDELMARLSDAAARLAEERVALPPGDPLHQEALTAGCVIAVYDPLTLRCTIARAGHPPPAVVRPDGTVGLLDVPEGPPLAGGDNEPFPAAVVELAEDSTLVLCTPSLAGALSGSGALRQVLERSGRRPLPVLCDEIAYAHTGATQSGTVHADGTAHTGDDLVLLARTRAFPADRIADFALPEGPEAAGAARAETRRRLAAWGVDEDTSYSTQVIVSELVGNAVRYGTPPLRLRLILDQALTCEVSDAGFSAPHLKHARTVDEGGRGLFIVSQLADQWGARYSASSKTIWSAQALPQG